MPQDNGERNGVQGPEVYLQGLQVFLSRKAAQLRLRETAPGKALQIALGKGHATTTQYEHYLNIPFEEEDRKELRKWVEGLV